MDEVKQSLKALSEAQMETDRQLKESQKEAHQHQQDLAQHIKKMSDEITRVENLFTTKWGKLMESLVNGDLVKLLQAKDVEVTKTLQNIRGKVQGEHWEVDILAINGEEIVVVEVKTTLRVKDVGRFITRTLKNFVTVFPEYEGKKIYGATAYLRAEEGADIYAQKQGLFAIRATGSSASIVNDEKFKPKAF